MRAPMQREPAGRLTSEALCALGSCRKQTVSAKVTDSGKHKTPSPERAGPGGYMLVTSEVPAAG
jgi:hypothetical protein